MKQFLFITICLITISCSNGNLEKNLDSLIKKEFSEDEPGGCILIMKGDKTVFLRSFGLADLNTKEKITENTIFNTGSISKTFVSNGILILKEQGLISLDDTITKFFNDFKNKSVVEEVKLKHLLSHTSGIPDIRNVNKNIAFYITAKDSENFAPLKFVDSLVFKPGEKFEYSNPVYNGLALIIEKVSGQAWQEFIRENIFKPSGMMNSVITNGPYPDSGVAHAYEVEDGKYIEYDYGEVPTFAAAGNGGVWSTVFDLAKYEHAIRENKFLSNELIQESRIPFYPENWSDTILPFTGYSWFLGEKSLFGNKGNFNVDLVYHTGSQGGFRAFYISIPEKDIIYIGLFNRPLKDFKNFLYEGVSLLSKNNWLD